MIDALFSQNTYLAAKKLLDATALRQEAIVNNVANLETPGYKRLDLAPNFQADLNRALAAGEPSALRQTQPQLAVDALATGSGPGGNNVELEKELLQLNQNMVAHAVETQLITGKLLQLRLAITGHSA